MVDLERIKAETVAYFRALDEAATQQYHFRHADEEGGLWYIEAVPDRGRHQASRADSGRPTLPAQMGAPGGHGFLTDQEVNPEADPLEAIPAEDFQRVWTR